MHRKRYIVLAVGLAIAVAAGTASGISASNSSADGTSPSTDSESVPDWVSQVAARLAKESGDPTPESVVAVSTTRGRAIEATSGDTVDSDQPVYLIVMTGSFTDSMAFIPPPAELPSGSVVTATVDVETQEVMDYQLGKAQPDLTGFGPATTVSIGGGQG